MDSTPIVSDFYIPSCMESSRSQPIGTALSLEAGKHLCLQHFLKRCRTFKQLLPPEQRGEVPVSLMDKIRLKWSQEPSGIYAGQPEDCRIPLLTEMASLTYQLTPVG